MLSGISSMLVFVCMLGLAAWRCDGNSAGIGVPCKTAQPNYLHKDGSSLLGHPDRGETELAKPNKTEAKHKLEAGYKMWWVLPPVHTNEYTVRTADGPTGSDPTSYRPGEWMDIYVRALTPGKKYQGLVVYATDSTGKTVGEWKTREESPFRYGADAEGNMCLTHSNGEYKMYLEVFRFKAPPRSTGTITFPAIIKEGLAFPVLEGHFYFPNQAPLKLTEAAPVPQQWFRGSPGQSCDQVCGMAGGNCDEEKLTTVGYNPQELYTAVKPYMDCPRPLLYGCSATTPAIGSEGCFVHREGCGATRAPTSKFVKPDPCAGAQQQSQNNFAAGECAVWNYVTQGNLQNGDQAVRSLREGYNSQYSAGQQVWVCNTAATGNAGLNGADSFTQGPLRIQDSCMPAGGWPTPQPTTGSPTPQSRPMAASSCAASHAGEKDGGRICPCNGATKVQIENSDPVTPTTLTPFEDLKPGSAYGADAGAVGLLLTLLGAFVNLSAE